MLLLLQLQLQLLLLLLLLLQLCEVAKKKAHDMVLNMDMDIENARFQSRAK